MDSILELDPSEIKQIKKMFKQQDENGNPLHSTFVEYSA